MEDSPEVPGQGTVTLGIKWLMHFPVARNRRYTTWNELSPRGGSRGGVKNSESPDLFSTQTERTWHRPPSHSSKDLVLGGAAC